MNVKRAAIRDKPMKRRQVTHGDRLRSHYKKNKRGTGHVMMDSQVLVDKVYVKVQKRGLINVYCPSMYRGK